MVLILDGSSDIGAQVRRNLCHLICLKHLIRSKAVTNLIFFWTSTGPFILGCVVGSIGYYNYCPRSLDLFYIVTSYIKWVKNFWTYSIYRNIKFRPHIGVYIVQIRRGEKRRRIPPAKNIFPRLC